MDREPSSQLLLPYRPRNLHQSRTGRKLGIRNAVRTSLTMLGTNREKLFSIEHKLPLNYINSTGAECLSESLVEHTSIQNVDLSHNHIGDDGIVITVLAQLLNQAHRFGEQRHQHLRCSAVPNPASFAQRPRFHLIRPSRPVRHPAVRREERRLATY